MATQPGQLYYCIIELPIQSFYLATLLSNLNARGYVKGRETEWNEYLSVLPDDSVSSTAGGSTTVNKRQSAYVLKDMVSSKDGLSSGTTCLSGVTDMVRHTELYAVTNSY